MCQKLAVEITVYIYSVYLFYRILSYRSLFISLSLLCSPLVHSIIYLLLPPLRRCTVSTQFLTSLLTPPPFYFPRQSILHFKLPHFIPRLFVTLSSSTLSIPCILYFLPLHFSPQSRVHSLPYFSFHIPPNSSLPLLASPYSSLLARNPLAFNSTSTQMAQCILTLHFPLCSSPLSNLNHSPRHLTTVPIHFTPPTNLWGNFSSRIRHEAQNLL